jgi:uncharacterized OsmC-like protein
MEVPLAQMPIYDGKSAILMQVNSPVTLGHGTRFVPDIRQKKGSDMATAQKLSTTINGVAVDSLFATIEAVKATPSVAKFKFRIRNQWENGCRNCSTAARFSGANQELSHPKPFTLEADEPAILLGKDMAANPVEYLLHALASCMTTSMVYHAAARGIHIEQVESSFEGDIDLHGFLGLDPMVRKGYQGIRVRFRIRANVPDDQLQEIVELGTRFSPVFDSLTNEVPVSVVAERL